MCVVKADEFIYSDKINHYSFILPSEWKEIPKAKIDEWQNLRKEQFSLGPKDFSAGFQLKDREYFQSPYFFVAEHKSKTPVYSQFLKIFSASDSERQKMTDADSSRTQELLNKTGIENLYVENVYIDIDKERNIIFMGMEIGIKNRGKAKSFDKSFIAKNAVFLGKHGMTELAFQAMKYEYSQYLPIFTSIIDSFNYEKGYEWNEVQAKQNNSEDIIKNVVKRRIGYSVERAFVKLILFAFIVGIVYFFKHILSKDKRNKK